MVGIHGDTTGFWKNWPKQYSSTRNPSQKNLDPDSIFVSEGGERRWIGRSQGLTEENAGSANLLGSTRDRIVAADLPGEWRENYPDIVKETGQRPDIVVWSESDPRLILIELTVPYESRIEEQHQYKLRKYEDLARKLTIDGRPTKVLPVEVGA